MKLKLGKANLENCTLELGGISELCPSDRAMDVVIDIENMSSDLRIETDRLIEIEKAKYICEMEKRYRKHPDYTKQSLKWCNEPVIIMASFLQVMLEVGKAIEYRIIVGFMDAADEFMDSVVAMNVDLSEYEAELKTVILKALIDRFF